MPFHELEEDLAFVLEEDLVLGKLAYGEKVSDQALIQGDLVTESEVDGKGVEDSFHVAQFVTVCDLGDVHHVVKAEEGIDVDARLQVTRQLERLLDKLYRISLGQDLPSVVHLMDRGNHLRQKPKCVRHKLSLLFDIHLKDLLRKLDK